CSRMTAHSACAALLSLSCSAAHRYLHPCPTRRSSDLHGLVIVDVAGHGSLSISAKGASFLRERSSLVLRALKKPKPGGRKAARRSEEHTSELQSREKLVCRLLLEKKKPSLERCLPYRQ